jgi:hypothetical protein
MSRPAVRQAVEFRTAEGRRNNAEDQAAIQRLHDTSVMPGAECAATPKTISKTKVLRAAEPSDTGVPDAPDIIAAIRAARSATVNRRVASVGRERLRSFLSVDRPITSGTSFRTTGAASEPPPPPIDINAAIRASRGAR